MAFTYKKLTSASLKRDSSVVGFLTRHRIIKNPKVAMFVTIIFCLVIIVSSTFVIYRANASGQPLPYSEISASAKGKLPISVQALYSNQQ